MRKKFFNWTPQDVADWEKIRSKGLLRFTLRYGMMLFGGVLFVLLGGIVVLFGWNKAHAASLLPELVVIALICFLGGLVNSLITWAVEERQYHKYKQVQNSENKPSE